MITAEHRQGTGFDITLHRQTEDIEGGAGLEVGVENAEGLIDVVDARAVVAGAALLVATLP